MRDVGVYLSLLIFVLKNDAMSLASAEGGGRHGMAGEARSEFLNNRVVVRYKYIRTYIKLQMYNENERPFFLIIFISPSIYPSIHPSILFLPPFFLWLSSWTFLYDIDRI